MARSTSSVPTPAWVSGSGARNGSTGPSRRPIASMPSWVSSVTRYVAPAVTPVTMPCWAQVRFVSDAAKVPGTDAAETASPT